MASQEGKEPLLIWKQYNINPQMSWCIWNTNAIMSIMYVSKVCVRFLRCFSTLPKPLEHVHVRHSDSALAWNCCRLYCRVSGQRVYVTPVLPKVIPVLWTPQPVLINTLLTDPHQVIYRTLLLRFLCVVVVGNYGSSEDLSTYCTVWGVGRPPDSEVLPAVLVRHTISKTGVAGFSLSHAPCNFG